MHVQHTRNGDSLPHLEGPRSSPMSSPFLSATELTSKWPLQCKIKQKASQVYQSGLPCSPRSPPGLGSVPRVPGNTQCQAGCQWGTSHKSYQCGCISRPNFFFFSFLFSFLLTPNRIVFWFWKASAGMQRTVWWLRRWWPSHLLCIVEYIFHMLLGETSNKGHPMLEIEQKR